MKKILLIFVLSTWTFSFAQIESFDSTHIAAIKKDLKGAFTEIVKENLTLTEEQAKIFWPIYDEYMAARNPIFEERVNVTEEYMMNYYAMDDETAKDLINRALQLNQDLLDVRKDYVNKLLDKLSPSIVGKFFQIDNRITTLADLVRMSSTPLVREEE